MEMIMEDAVRGVGGGMGRSPRGRGGGAGAPLAGVPTMSFAVVGNNTSVPGGVDGVGRKRVAEPDVLAQEQHCIVAPPGTAAEPWPVTRCFDRATHSFDEICDSILLDAGGSTPGAGDDGHDDGPMLQPMQVMFAMGTSMVVYVLGSAISSKSDFVGSHLIKSAATSLLNMLQHQGAQLPGGGAGDAGSAAAGMPAMTNAAGDFDHPLTASVNCSYVEFFDETITDLQRPEAKKLRVAMSAEEGVVIEGVHRTRVRRWEDVDRIVQTGTRNRDTTTSASGPAIESSTAIFEFYITMTRHEVDGDDIKAFRFAIVELPSTHKLLQAADALRRQDGPTLNQSLLQLVTVVDLLASRSPTPPPFRRSLLTGYLHEMMGGNAIAIAIGLLAQGEPDVSSKGTLRLLQRLSMLVQYPVPNTQQLVALVMRYRIMLAQVLDDAMMGKDADAALTGAEARAHEQELETRLMQAELSTTAAKDDSARLYKMLELFQQKYARLLEDKEKQAAELVAAEEGKLEVAKALLELRLEVSKKEQEWEEERNATQNEMIAVKSELVEQEMQCQDTRKEADEAAELVKQQEAELVSLKERMAAQDATETGLRERCKEEKDKNVQLGADFLTVTNQLQAVEQERDTLQEQRDTAKRELEVALAAAEQSKQLQDDAETTLAQRMEELLDLKDGKARAENELRKALLGFEQERLVIDKTTAAYVRDKDAELLEARQATEDAVQRLKHEKDEAVQALKQQEALRRGDARRIRDTQLRLERCMADLDALRSSDAALQDRYDTSVQDYREQLGTLIDMEASAKAISTTSANNSNDAAAASGAADPLESYLQTYRDAEALMQQENRALREQTVRLLQRQRTIYDRYRAALDLLQDHAPEAVPESIIEEKDLESAAKSESGTKEQQTHEIGQLRTELERAQRAMTSQQSKGMEALEKYRGQLAQLEAARQSDAQELVSLRTQIEVLQRENQKLLDEGTIKKLEEMQQSLIEQLTRLRDRSTGESSSLSSMRAKLIALQDENGRLQEQAAAPHGQASEAVMRENNALKRKLQDLESNANRALLDQVADLERERAQLLRSNQQLTTELETYKEYMQTAFQQRRRPSQQRL